MAPLGCAKSLLRHLWVASFVTLNVRNCSARNLNRDSKRQLSILAIAIASEVGRCDGAGAACCELLVVRRTYQGVADGCRRDSAYCIIR